MADVAAGAGDAGAPKSPLPREPALDGTGPAQWLCRSTRLVDGARALVFDVRLYGQSQRAFALRHDGVVRAYLNRCAHVPAEMDWQPGEFLDETGRWLICSIHGATYRPDNGLCVSGPCPGRRLHALDVHERGGDVWWQPTQAVTPALAGPPQPVDRR